MAQTADRRNAIVAYAHFLGHECEANWEATFRALVDAGQEGVGGGGGAAENLVKKKIKVVISDRDKGLKNAIATVFGHGAVAFCCSNHMRDNILSNFGQAAAKAFMEVVHSQTKRGVREALKRLEKCNGGRALKYLYDGIGGENNKYTIFRPYSKIWTGGLSNQNCSEQDNAAAKEAREAVGFFATLLICMRRISITYSNERARAYGTPDRSDRCATPSYQQSIDIQRTQLLRSAQPRHYQETTFPNPLNKESAQVPSFTENDVFRTTTVSRNGSSLPSCSCGRFWTTGEPCHHFFVLSTKASFQDAAFVPLSRSMGAWRAQFSIPQCCVAGDCSELALDSSLQNPWFLPKPHQRDNKRHDRFKPTKRKITCSACTKAGLSGAAGHSKNNSKCPVYQQPLGSASAVAAAAAAAAATADVVHSGDDDDDGEEEEDLVSLSFGNVKKRRVT